MPNTEDSAHRWLCPGCDHQIIGVEDWDECAGLIDEHLQKEHGLTIQQYMESGMGGGV